MIYQGIVIDSVYGEPDINNSNSNRFWARLKTNRIYSDEVTMSNGWFAYKRYIYLKSINNHVAAKAWKKLI